MTDNSPENMEWPDHKEANKLLQTAFEHYNIHYDVVLKKLGHAQEATNLSLKDGDAEETTSAHSDSWGEIITLFKECGITEEELFQIEKVLKTLPENIRVHFERLIKIDQTLQKLMQTLEEINYKETIKTINRVQTQPNPMSGLERDDYETSVSETTEDDAVRVFSFVPEEASNDD